MICSAYKNEVSARASNSCLTLGKGRCIYSRGSYPYRFEVGHVVKIVFEESYSPFSPETLGHTCSIHSANTKLPKCWLLCFSSFLNGYDVCAFCQG